MKRTIWMTIGILILMAGRGASAQSLGDYARSVRKEKPPSNTTTRHYDNDNLPTNDKVSVVGPEPAAPADNGQGTAKTDEAKKPGPGGAGAPEEEKQKANEELQKKLATQKDKLDGLNRDLDLTQREYKLRAAAFYADAGNRLRNSAQWDKDDAQYKSDIESKQKAVDAARQDLDNLQEKARKAGVRYEEKGNDKDK